MAVNEDTEREYVPQKEKQSSEEEKRKKKILPGSLMKALLRPGGGDLTPLDGDQIIYHCTIRTLDGVVVQSTRSEFGGKGVLTRHVLGKSKMLLGLLEGIPTMLKGEVAMFKMKPQLHFGEVDCPISAPDGFPKEDELHFEIEMIDFFKAKVVTDDLGVIKKVICEGQGWESPREPYEVKAWISAKTVAGKLVVPRIEEPYFFTFGKSEVPKGLEMGIGTMTRGEKAVIFVCSQYLTQSPLMPLNEDYEEVQFEVELFHFIQVRDMLGDGRLIKRRIRDGKGDFPMDCPLHDSLLRVHYKGMVLDKEKRVFYDTRVDNEGQPLEFCSGEGLVPEGFEMCVRLMLPGEVALVTCPPDFAYDKFPRPANVNEGANIQWEIELLGFEMPKDWTGFDFQSIMDDAEKIRNTGNRLFKEGKYELAKTKYEKLLREFNHINPQDDEEAKVFSDTRVLDANPAHVKGLYRRGMAYMAAGDFEEAKSDFNMVMKVDKSTEPDATSALLKLKQKEQEAEKKARKQFKGLFDKKPGEIAEVTAEEDKDQKISESKEEDEGHGGSDSENSHEVAPDAPQVGWFSRFLPSRLLSSLWLRRCTIL